MSKGYAAIGLDNAKTPINVGHVLRAAHAYGVAMVAVSGTRYRRCSTDVSGAYASIPLIHCEDVLDAIPFDCVPVGVELVDYATSLVDYVHPPRAYYIFGAEDNSLGKRVLSKCRDVIYVPTSICMNLSACANTVLYDRLAKASRA